MTSLQILLHFLLFLFICITLCPLSSNGCHEEERRAHRLSSWQEGVQHRNCCAWRGIRCSSESFHVISIDLRNIDLESYHYYFPDSSNPPPPPNTSLRGKLSPHLFNITHLEYLDLGFNDFQGSEIPHEFSHLMKLNHLDLPLSNFSASISTQFSNLTFLQYLELLCYLSTGVDDWSMHIYYTFCLVSPSTKWVRGLVNLQVLRLSGIFLLEAATYSNEINFSKDISYLRNLRDLDASGCYIHGPAFPIHEFQNLSHLSTLKMNDNLNLNSWIPVQLANLTSLSVLELSSCDLKGSMPYLPQLKELHVSSNLDIHTDLARMFEHPWPRLQKLHISATNASGSSVPRSITNAPNLVYLSAAKCSLQRLAFSISNLKSLQYLNFMDLSSNNFQESIPKSICQLFSLRHLYLANNNITGTIPGCLTKLRNLTVFNVFQNLIGGEVSLISLINN